MQNIYYNEKENTYTDLVEGQTPSTKFLRGKRTDWAKFFPSGYKKWVFGQLCVKSSSLFLSPWGNFWGCKRTFNI